jgi:hypothetical protein
MKWSRFVCSISLAFVGPFNTVGAETQQAAKVARIGWLGDDPTRAPHLRETFLQGLRDLGYVEGRNLVVERRYSEGKFDRIAALATELVALNVDVIVDARTSVRATARAPGGADSGPSTLDSLSRRDARVRRQRPASAERAREVPGI